MVRSKVDKNQPDTYVVAENGKIQPQPSTLYPVYTSSQEGSFELPIILNVNGKQQFIKFYFTAADGQPQEYRVIAFCNQYQLPKSSCKRIYESVMNTIYTRKHEFFGLSFTSSLYDQKERHLPKLKDAMEAEASSVQKNQNDEKIREMLSREHATKDILKRYFFSPFSISSSSSHIPTPHTIYVVIHSCLLPSNPSDTRILSQLLDHVLVMVQSHQSGALMDRRYRRATDNTKRGEGDGRRSKVKVLVLHYGVSLPDEFMESYSQLYENGQNHTSTSTSTNPDANRVQDDYKVSFPRYWNCKQHPNSCEQVLHFVHVSDDTGFFEIPTMRLISYLSREDAEIRQHQHLQHGTNLKVNHILYLHTKGVSYAELYQQIEDWREYMLYFLVDEHAKMYRVLLSGQYDVVGVSYYPRPRMLSGNYWYVAINYLKNLPFLEYHTSGKYDAEYWLLRGHFVRLYYPHVSHHYIYPRFCYATLGKMVPERNNSKRILPSVVPEYDQWIKNCSSYVKVYYDKIHGMDHDQFIDDRVGSVSKFARCRGSTFGNIPRF